LADTNEQMTLRAVSASASAPAARSSANGGETDADRSVIAQLTATDRHVRAHEEAHLAAAGPYATGGPTYIYQQGPDGKMYVVGGEVTLDDSPVSGDPQATIEKEKTVIAAANAPADPSAQDRAVASAAAVQEQAAERELRQQQDQQSSASRGQAAASYNPPVDAVGQVIERYF
jgi:hypothetical protein